MTIDDFYVLDHPTRDGLATEGSWAEGHTDIDCPFCPKCGGIMGMRRSRAPLLVKLENMGHGFTDLVWMPGYAILFSRRILDAVKQAGYTRLLDVIGQAEIVKTVNRKRSFRGVPPEYFSCEVGTENPALNLVASGMVRTKPIDCSYCLERGVICSMKRLYMDMKTWSGEDIFRPRGLGGAVVVTRRFVTLLRELNATGFMLMPALQYSIDYSDAFPNGIPSVPPHQ